MNLGISLVIVAELPHRTGNDIAVDPRKRLSALIREPLQLTGALQVIKKPESMCHGWASHDDAVVSEKQHLLVTQRGADATALGFIERKAVIAFIVGGLRI